MFESDIVSLAEKWELTRNIYRGLNGGVLDESWMWAI